eukprot:TRINITY_DN5020_c0_g2_i1.p1 TRINITY_DN5020_c0_g2~~TRINITY_DN5020_c0_g2_i1.p1  ORF type:complete len:755 (-),score=116.10 TRINITY_DN5020_c0_g2_i1:691-2955(-)
MALRYSSELLDFGSHFSQRLKIVKALRVQNDAAAPILVSASILSSDDPYLCFEIAASSHFREGVIHIEANSFVDLPIAFVGHPKPEARVHTGTLSILTKRGDFLVKLVAETILPSFDILNADRIVDDDLILPPAKAGQNRTQSIKLRSRSPIPFDVVISGDSQLKPLFNRLTLDPNDPPVDLTFEYGASWASPKNLRALEFVAAGSKRSKLFCSYQTFEPRVIFTASVDGRIIVSEFNAGEDSRIARSITLKPIEGEALTFIVVMTFDTVCDLPLFLAPSFESDALEIASPVAPVQLKSREKQSFSLKCTASNLKGTALINLSLHLDASISTPRIANCVLELSWETSGVSVFIDKSLVDVGDLVLGKEYASNSLPTVTVNVSGPSILTSGILSPSANVHAEPLSHFKVSSTFGVPVLAKLHCLKPGPIDLAIAFTLPTFEIVNKKVKARVHVVRLVGHASADWVSGLAPAAIPVPLSSEQMAKLLSLLNESAVKPELLKELDSACTLPELESIMHSSSNASLELKNSFKSISPLLKSMGEDLTHLRPFVQAGANWAAQLPAGTQRAAFSSIIEKISSRKLDLSNISQLLDFVHECIPPGTAFKDAASALSEIVNKGLSGEDALRILDNHCRLPPVLSQIARTAIHDPISGALTSLRALEASHPAVSNILDFLVSSRSLSLRNPLDFVRAVNPRGLKCAEQIHEMSELFGTNPRSFAEAEECIQRGIEIASALDVNPSSRLPQLLKSIFSKEAPV